MTSPQQPEPTWQPPPSPAAPARKSRRTLWIVLTVCGAVVVLCCGGLTVFGLVVGPPHTSAARSLAPRAAAAKPSTPTAASPTRVAVTATPSPASPATPPAQAAAAQPAAGYGFLQTVAWWDRAFRVVPADECATAGETPPVGTQHAWQLPNGGLACVDEGPNAWSDHIIAVDIFFPTAVGEQKAVTVAASLLPPDAAHTGTFDGTNPDYSTKPNGSCRQFVFTSATVRTVVTGLNPSWTGDPSKATAILYSGNATSENGAELPYNPNHVHLAMLMINGETRGPNGGTVGC